MRVTFLGTGTSQGVPVVACPCDICSSDDARDKRLRCSILIDLPGATWVVDAGPDFRQQMLLHRVEKLDAILFTHLHKDHTGGFDDVRAFYFRTGKPINVFLDALTESLLRREYPYIFDGSPYPGIPKVQLHAFEGAALLALDGYGVQAVPVWHHRLPVYGFRIGGFAYITDANRIPEESMALLQGLDILVINALQYEQHISHFTVPEALAVVERLAPGQAYLTHISHRLGRHAVVSADLPGGVALAYDNLVVELADPLRR